MPNVQERSFIFEGMRAAYYQGGSGPRLLLLHGSGPGASSLGNWRSVLGPLSERYEVYAMDLIGFGKSERKPAPPYFDFDLWVRQARAMLAHIGPGPIGLIGHSLAAAISLTITADNPDIRALLTTGAMGARFEPTPATGRTWRCPTNREELVAALSGLIYDTSIIDDAYLAPREPVIFAPGYADYFNSMFEGDPHRYIEASLVSDDTLAQVRCPVIMLHGRNDSGFPASSSIHLAQRIPGADVMLLHHCSHSVAFERTDIFLAMADVLFGSQAD